MSAPLKLTNLDQLIERYKSGVSMNQLAAEAGVVRISLMRIFKRAGVTLRGHSDAERLKWSGMDRAATERQCRSAWDACRGRRRSDSEMLKRAEARSRIISPFEDAVCDALLGRIGFERQHPVGKYNLDIAMTGHGVAVEIEASRSTLNAKSIRERTRYLLYGEWCVLFVRLRRSPTINILLPDVVADELVALAERASGDHSIRGHYGVIWGDGQPSTTRGSQLYGLPRIPGL